MNDNNRKQEYSEMPMNELYQLRREAQERLLVKEREYNLIAQLNPEELNKLLLGQGLSGYSIDPSLLIQQRIKSEDQNQDKSKEQEKSKKSISMTQQLQLDRRLPIYDKALQNKIKRLKEDSFYDNIPKERIKDIQNEIKEKKKKIFYDDTHKSFEVLQKDYYNKYLGYLQDEVSRENLRKNTRNDMIDMISMVACLKDPASLQKPAVWNVNVLDEYKSQQINKIVNDKIKIAEKGESFKKDKYSDITDKVDKFLRDHHFSKLEEDKTQNINNLRKTFSLNTNQ